MLSRWAIHFKVMVVSHFHAAGQFPTPCRAVLGNARLPQHSIDAQPPGPLGGRLEIPKAKPLALRVTIHKAALGSRTGRDVLPLSIHQPDAIEALG